MKKLSVLIILLMSIPVFATDKNNFLVYPVYGIGSTAGAISMYGKNSETEYKYGSETSYEVSLNGDYYLTDSFAFCSGIGYTSKPLSGKLKNKTTGTYNEVYIDAKYITVPLMLGSLLIKTRQGLGFLSKPV